MFSLISNLISLNFEFVVFIVVQINEVLEGGRGDDKFVILVVKMVYSPCLRSARSRAVLLAPCKHLAIYHFHKDN